MLVEYHFILERNEWINKRGDRETTKEGVKNGCNKNKSTNEKHGTSTWVASHQGMQ